MKKITDRHLAKKIASILILVSIALSSTAFAAEGTRRTEKGLKAKEVKKQVTVRTHVRKREVRKKTVLKKAYFHKEGKHKTLLREGWKLTSHGGLLYEHPCDANYWFQLSGVLRWDEVFFMGTYRDTNGFPNGSRVRTADLYFDGGVGQDWSYTLQVSFFGDRASFSETYISYSGFYENNQVYIGLVPGNWFGLDDANSTSWNPFLERSLPTIAFYPGNGVGVMTDFWWEYGGLTLTAMQADQVVNNIFIDRGRGLRGLRDPWKGTVRATFAPVHDAGNVWHMGISGAFFEVPTSFLNGTPVKQFVGFATPPSAIARNTAALVNTRARGADGDFLFNLQADRVSSFNVEMARQCGPILLEGEYTQVQVHRVNNPQGSVQFHGWDIQGRYLLTGEYHEYDVRDGAFGAVKPLRTWGAIEIAARFDYITLNNKDVLGGSEHDVTVGLNWFLNYNWRLSANYIRAKIHPATGSAAAAISPTRYLDIIGVRAQVRFK